MEKEKEILYKLQKDSEEQLNLKIQELANIKRMILDYENKNEELALQLEKTRNKLKVYEEKNNTDFEKVRNDIENFKDTISTKNRMLEDKNIAISELKEQLSVKEDEIERLKGVKNDTRQLDDQIEKERYSNEKLRKKVDKQANYINELEENIQGLKEELSSNEDLISDLRAQIENKREVHLIKY